MRRVDDRLRVRQVVQRRDRAVADPDPLVDHLDDGREAVGRAGGGGDDVVARRVVEVVVDADDDVQGAVVLDRRGDDDLLARRARSSGSSASSVRNLPGALEHDVDAGARPSRTAAGADSVE